MQAADDVTAHIATRLIASEPNRLELFQIETDIIENLTRIGTYIRRISRLSLRHEIVGVEEKKPAEESRP
jgi:hypothetical protein